MIRLLTGAAAIWLCSSVIWAQQPAPLQPRGVAPRSTPADYTAHVSINGVTYAASLLSPAEVKHAFAFDISRSYVVFEVAVYPQSSARIDLDPNGFVVRSSHSGEPLRPSDSVTVASDIQQKNLPPLPSRGPAVTASTAIGYESGTDPYTGQRYHGTYTASQVAVDNRDNFPPVAPSPGGYPQDRALLENQLWDKSLPQARVERPTAGYLYFPSSPLKKKSSGEYELEYLGSRDEPVLNGGASSQRIVLVIPAKTKSR